MGRRPKTDLRGESMGPDQVIGMAAKIALRNGQALRTDDLIKPQIVQRNEAVTIYYEVPGIMLTVRGKAVEGGAMGDVVGVLNIQSNRPVQATVIAPGRVSIAAAGPLIATAAAPETDDPSPPRTQ
jgi:flagella basal body P-ring formation protein FlgA